MYFLECLKCQIQYVGKSENEFNIKLNNHRQDVTRMDSLSASNHFNIEGHNFNIHAKFILTEQVNQSNLDKLTLQKRLKIRENF